MSNNLPPLLPCPFCGGKGSLVIGGRGFNDCNVFCESCDASSSVCPDDEDGIEASKAWNRRAALAQAQSCVPADEVQAMAEEVERLQTALAFWMPDVPPTDHPLYKRVANDVYLLVGFDGPTPEPSAFELGHVSLAAIEANTPAASGARVVECARRLVEHADFALGGCLSASSKARDIPSKACSQVKARHLAALRDVLAASPQPQPVQPSEHVPEVHFGKTMKPETLRVELQKMCSAWGAYWRASDAHGVELTTDQAVELLQNALNVEVEIKDEEAGGQAKPEQAAQQWQPIETAPKNAVILIGYEPHPRLKGSRRVYEGRWHEAAYKWGSVNGFIVHDEATHWMPLPAPPKPKD